ncbi:MAG: single-stranded DNA-binding protein [Sulfuritalea sp.]|nr:single-stranded DNA-binding protein [Sulfuritalea sp.]
MIDGLIGGKLHGKPAQRVGQSGKAFVTAKVRTPTGNGDTLFVNVIAFSESVGAALLALDDGDSVSVSGALTPKAWTDKNGEVKPSLDMVAHALLTTYHVTRKRQAASKSASSPGPRFDDDEFGEGAK